MKACWNISTHPNGFNEKTSTATAYLEIKDTSDVEVKIHAKTGKIPTAYIDVSSAYGRFAGNSSRVYKQGEVQEISFTSDSDYQFIRWQIIDKSTNEEISNCTKENGGFIKIDDIKDANTNFTFVNDPAVTAGSQFRVTPLCAKRPKVVSTSPLYDSNGVYRDRRIIVMFNKPMDDASIYFDEKEIPEGMTGIPSTKASGKYYAYWNGHDSQTLVFKTISITKRNDPNYNLLSCYNEPYFDSTDKSVLRIDAKQGENAPPGATEIIVTIKSQIGFKLENTLVNLSGDYEWAYYTNGKTDKDPPEFAKNGDDGFTVLYAEAGQTKDVSTKPLLTSFAGDALPDVYKNNNLKSETIWVKGRFYDTGSGPKSLKWNLYKVNDKYYPTDETKIEEGQIDELEITGADAVIKSKETNAQGQMTDVDGIAVKVPLTEKDEGLYRIDFICTGKNEKTSDPLSYYFVHDKVAPKDSTVVLVSTLAKDAVKVKVENSDFDFSHGIFESATSDEGDVFTFENLDASTKTHSITVKSYDFVGNYSTDIVPITSVPAVGMIYYKDGYWGDSDHYKNDCKAPDEKHYKRQQVSLMKSFEFLLQKQVLFLILIVQFLNLHGDKYSSAQRISF